MLESSGFMPLGKAEEWSMDTATCHLSRCVVEGKSLLKKSLHPQFLSDEKLRTCMRKEYETGRLLSATTPYVVCCHRLIDTPEECAILMDFVDGLTLEDFMRAHPLYFLDGMRLDAFMRQLLEALKAIHHAQVVHLDIKPTNLLLTSVNNDLRVIDFGMSFFSTYPHTEGLTTNFAAPEQTDGMGDVDCRTDIYAVGKILEYIERKLRRVEGEEGESYYLPPLWQSVKAKCLMPQKEERWQDVEDILSFLKGAKHRNTGKGKNKNRLWYAVAGVLLVMIAIFAFLFATRNDATTFADEYGNRYQVKSEEQLTCCLVGRDDTCTNVNLYIEPHILYKGKRYRVVEIGDNAFYGDNSVV